LYFTIRHVPPPICPLSLHDALPIYDDGHRKGNAQPAVGLPNPVVPVQCDILSKTSPKRIGHTYKYCVTPSTRASCLFDSRLLTRLRRPVGHFHIELLGVFWRSAAASRRTSWRRCRRCGRWEFR